MRLHDSLPTSLTPRSHPWVHASSSYYIMSLLFFSNDTANGMNLREEEQKSKPRKNGKGRGRIEKEKF